MKKMKKTGFTLAEVLITLTIIGVVSALTIPVLVQKTNKQEYVSALQKAYSTLSQAANMIIAEEGSPKCDDGGWACSTEEVYSMFKKYLSNAKDCGSGSGCFESSPYGGAWDTEPSHKKLVLADGMQIMFDDSGKSNDCSKTSYGSFNTCARMHIDINGEKQPNKYGRDTFQFVLKENGLYPAGCDDNVCTNNSFAGCTCKVLREGKMDY